MNLRDKLNRLEKNDTLQESKERNADYINKNAFQYNVVENEDGVYLKTTATYPSHYKHGLYAIQKFFKQLDTNILATITNSNDLEINKNIKNNILFIDTETTGLMGGTGTVSFLIGIGYFHDEKFVVEQYLMRDYDEETPMLIDIKKKLKEHDIVISFNGKSFDIPLIKTRLILNRLKRPDFKLHVDLLHSARRLWSFLDSCSLNSLEKNILDFKRVDDIPGNLIPELYFEFLENKDLKQLIPILEHNRYDILSLVTLFTHLKEIHLDNIDNLSPHELYQMGRIKEKDKNYESCINYLEKSMKNSEQKYLEYKAMKKLSWQYKRVDRYEKAVEIWQSMIKKSPLDVFPYVEMAKFFEHREKDYKKALSYTNQAIKLLSKHRIITNNFKKEMDNLKYRKKRLFKKICKD
ncbi:MAG: ribonuclease H-like domain-containing protein [Halanaerobiales bacterium]|nr:ribonuclease H-like domain-containing protein [Halanaerobiales bacterium]